MVTVSLRKARISRIGPGLYRCNQCGETWSPNLMHGGRLPKGWWRCPNGCNNDVIPPGTRTQKK